MYSTISKRESRIGFYLLVGFAYCMLQILGGLWKYPDKLLWVILNHIWLTLYITAVNYILFEFTLTFLRWKKLYLFILLIIGHFILYPFVFYGWQQAGVFLNIYTRFSDYNFWKWLEVLMGYAVGSVFFFGLCNHVYNYVNLRRTALQLKFEKQEAELNYLKSQTNPHFLFNTLNNIYSLTRDKSDRAPESILRLSQILRYMLYETGGAYIGIEQEIKIISDYIELEKLRYDDALLVNFYYDIEDMRQSIPPLLLVPLVENAFKHGVSETRNRPFADIHISIKNRILNLVVKNSTEQTESFAKENIGLSNLRRQLELLFTDYSLTTKNNERTFIVSLTINLSSHV